MQTWKLPKPTRFCKARPLSTWDQATAPRWATSGQEAPPQNLVLKLGPTLDRLGAYKDPGPGSSPGLISSALGLVQA